MEEAAEALGMCRRNLQDLVKKYPFYYPNGRRKLFEEKDIDALRTALRREAEEERDQCRSKLSRPEKARRHITASAGRTSGSIWTEAQKRVAELKRQDSSSSGKTKSTVVPLPSRANPHS